MKKEILRYGIIGILLLVVLGAFVFYQTHKSVEQELSEEDKELQDLLQEQTTTQTSSESLPQEPSSGEEVVQEANEEPNESSFTEIKSGEFNPDAEDSDRFHRGSGGVSLLNFDGINKIVFEEDFEVTNGPDYKLYLLEAQGVETEARFEELRDSGDGKIIAEVKQFDGFQTFEVPEDIDPDEIGSLVIWCESFSEFITSADLN